MAGLVAPEAAEPDLLSLNAFVHGDAGGGDSDIVLKTIIYLQSWNLLRQSNNCVCGQTMSMKPKGRRSATSAYSDKYCWRCPVKSCQKRISVRTGSIFSDSKLQLYVLLHIFYMFSQDVPIYIAHRLLRLHVSENSIIEWYDFLRGFLSKKLIQNPIRFYGEDVTLQVLQNGGADVDCEITEEGVEFDESTFGKKAKHHRGTSKQNTIVFGIVARSGTKCTLRIVPNVQKVTLWPHIEADIDKSCTIYSDGLATYQSLNDIGYTHRVVNHSKELVTSDGVHTNTIEGLWGLMKQRISRMHGLKTADRLAAHLDEFSYRQSYSVNGSIWNSFVEICRAQ